MNIETRVLNIGIYEIIDLKTTQGGQWLFIAYSSGAVNVHNMGDKSLNFIF